MGRPRRSQKYVRRRPTLELPEKVAAKEVRTFWPDLQARAQADPEMTLAIGILTSSRADFLRYAEAAKQLRRAKEAVSNTASWMFNEDADLQFDLLARAVGRDPNRLREAMFRGVDQNLVRMCMGGKNWVCPVCGGKH
jgi:rubrerythrin